MELNGEFVTTRAEVIINGAILALMTTLLGFEIALVASADSVTLSNNKWLAIFATGMTFLAVALLTRQVLHGMADLKKQKNREVAEIFS